MPLNIVVLDCSNYPQIATVPEGTIEESTARWEKVDPGVGEKPTKVFQHLAFGDTNREFQVAEALTALCKIYQFNRQFTELLEQIFRMGREFERAYPEGRGSAGDKRVYRPEGEVEFFVEMLPNALYRKDRIGCAQWYGAGWHVIEEVPSLWPSDQRDALYYLKDIAKTSGVVEPTDPEVLFAKATEATTAA